jgi:TM2 domain
MVKTEAEKYCHECGEIIRAKAEICPKCGVRQPYHSAASNIKNEVGQTIGQGNPRSKSFAALLALFLGGLGIHKFYMCKTGWGVIYLVFFWTFIPMILGFIEALNFLTMSKKCSTNAMPGQPGLSKLGFVPKINIR